MKEEKNGRRKSKKGKLKMELFRKSIGSTVCVTANS
jgi:hypothetical protein